MSSGEQEALRLANALDLSICAYPPHYTDVDAAAAELRRLVAEREADRAAMREALEALETCDPGDWSTGHVIHPSYDESSVDAAISLLKERTK